MKTTFAVHWQYGVATHAGWFGTRNDDRSLLRIGATNVGEPYALAVIADGMGGIGDGSLASDCALEGVRQWLDTRLSGILVMKDMWSQLDASVERLFYDINTKLLQLGKEAGTQMGTTLTLLFLLRETFYVCHVGDCRIYQFGSRLSPFMQLTKDQTWTAEQVRKRRISREAARNHAKRHVLLQSLGSQDRPKLVKRRGFYDPNHLFLLCSDGLYDRLPNSRIASILRQAELSKSDLQQLSERLVDSALDSQAIDNISVMLLRPLHSHFSAGQRIWHRMKNLHVLLPVTWRK